MYRHTGRYVSPGYAQDEATNRRTLDVNILATIRPMNIPIDNDTHVGSRFNGFVLLGCIT